MNFEYTRIRYIPTRRDGVFRSQRRFKGNQDAIYEVEIDVNDMTYKIRNLRQRTIVRSTEKDGVKPPKHENTLKKQAKRALQTMGVVFKLDMRGLDV